MSAATPGSKSQEPPESDMAVYEEVQRAAAAFDKSPTSTKLSSAMPQGADDGKADDKIPEPINTITDGEGVNGFGSADSNDSSASGSKCDTKESPKAKKVFIEGSLTEAVFKRAVHSEGGKTVFPGRDIDATRSDLHTHLKNLYGPFWSPDPQEPASSQEAASPSLPAVQQEHHEELRPGYLKLGLPSQATKGRQPSTEPEPSPYSERQFKPGPNNPLFGRLQSGPRYKNPHSPAVGDEAESEADRVPASVDVRKILKPVVRSNAPIKGRAPQFTKGDQADPRHAEKVVAKLQEKVGALQFGTKTTTFPNFKAPPFQFQFQQDKNVSPSSTADIRSLAQSLRLEFDEKLIRLEGRLTQKQSAALGPLKAAKANDQAKIGELERKLKDSENSNELDQEVLKFLREDLKRCQEENEDLKKRNKELEELVGRGNVKED